MSERGRRSGAAALLLAGAADLVFLNQWVFPRVVGAAHAEHVSVARTPLPLLDPVTAPPVAPVEPPPPEPDELIERAVPLGRAYFGFSQPKLDRAAEARLRVLAATAKADDVVAIVIEGHADQIGSPAFNTRLSEQRAAGVASRLVELGVPRERLLVRHYGDSRPAATSPDRISQRRNRRVEIGIVKIQAEEETP